jgi:hypothetical protein
MRPSHLLVLVKVAQYGYWLYSFSQTLYRLSWRRKIINHLSFYMGRIPSAPVMLALKYFVLVDDCCYKIIVAVIA